MESACLQTRYFLQDHTGEHIAEALQDALSNWKLEEKRLVAITTDNGSNVVKAAQLLKWLRMQCFGPRLHLAIGEYNGKVIVTGKRKCVHALKRLFAITTFSHS